MRNLRFEFNNMFSFNVDTRHGVTEKQLQRISQAVQKAHKHLEQVIAHPENRVRPGLEWTQLPFQDRATVGETQRFGEEIAYASAKLRYGDYPPHSSSSYICANRKHHEKTITSSYTGTVTFVLLREGSRQLRAWVTENVHIVNDYEKAVGNKPPPFAQLAVMNDSDNTGEQTVCYLDYIEVYRE